MKPQYIVWFAILIFALSACDNGEIPEEDTPLVSPYLSSVDTPSADTLKIDGPQRDTGCPLIWFQFEMPGYNPNDHDTGGYSKGNSRKPTKHKVIDSRNQYGEPEYWHVEWRWNGALISRVCYHYGTRYPCEE